MIQEDMNQKISRLGQQAPNFITHTLLEERFEFSVWQREQWIGFFYCTGLFHEHTRTLLQFMAQYTHFNQAGVKLLGVTNAEPEVLTGWLSLLQILGNKPLPFSLVYDCDDIIKNSYGLNSFEHDLTRLSFFLIDPRGIIRAVYSYPMNGYYDFETIFVELTEIQARYAINTVGIDEKFIGYRLSSKT